MRVLVCGGRYFGNSQAKKKTDRDTSDSKARKDLNSALDKLQKNRKVKIDTIIHGGCSGADSLAQLYAVEKNINPIVCVANWKGHGKAGGPIRNQEMLDKHKPDFVLAMPGGKGTQDMINRAKKAGIETMVYGFTVFEDP